MESILFILLYPLALLYGFFTAIRNRLYDIGILKSKTFEKVKTIVVGNLSVGGTGKTPHIEYLIRLLEKNYKVATLSRGYKRKTSGFILADENSSASDIGDEPLQFKSKFPNVHVAVDSKRTRGIEKLISQENNPSVILLDDAFQHRSVKPGLSILLTDYHKLFYKDYLLPAGRLRESKSNFLRADVIVVTRTPESATMIDMRSIIKDVNMLAYQSIFFSYIKYGNLYNLHDPSKTIRPAMELFRYAVIVLTGIANANHLLTFVKEYAESVTHQKFSDHHVYNEKDIDNIIKTFDAVRFENKIIITTEKDAMRLNHSSLKSLLKSIPIFVLPIEIDFKNKSEEFNEIITKYVSTNKIYHSKYM